MHNKRTISFNRRDDSIIHKKQEAGVKAQLHNFYLCSFYDIHKNSFVCL